MSEQPDRMSDTKRWLRFAREDLATAELLLAQPDATPRHICWLAQQATEKILKAVLIFLAIDFPRQHDLDALRQRIPWEWHVTKQFPDLAELTQWAVESRYPGDWAEATPCDARHAVMQARGVWASVTQDLATHGLHDV